MSVETARNVMHAGANYTNINIMRQLKYSHII
jgi:hypothetical protein